MTAEHGQVRAVADLDDRPLGTPAGDLAAEPATGRPGPAVFRWTVALASVIVLLGVAWFALSRGSGNGGASSTDGGPETVASTETPSTEASDDQPPTLSAEVQAAILLFQNPDSDVRTLVTEGVALPATGISDDGFTFRNCETQLVGLQAAFGGPGLTQLRDEIAQWPSGAPSGYVDPAGADRGFRERLEAYVEQTEAGYRLCVDQADMTLVGPRVLGGWASMQSFLCVTGVAAQVALGDGTVQTCPAADEADLCVRILDPMLDDYFLAFPDSRPEAAAACEAAEQNDPARFESLAAGST